MSFQRRQNAQPTGRGIYPNLPQPISTVPQRMPVPNVLPSAPAPKSSQVHAYPGSPPSSPAAKQLQSQQHQSVSQPSLTQTFQQLNFHDGVGSNANGAIGNNVLNSELLAAGQPVKRSASFNVPSVAAQNQSHINSGEHFIY